MHYLQAVAITAFIVFMTQKHLPLDPRALQQGLAHASWAGRLEKLNDAPLIVLDGAHNEPGIQALAQTLKTTFAQREIYVIFAALQDKATDKMLAQQLRELEKDGLINRKVYPVVPPKTEYSLTAFGKTLTPILDELCKWGENYLLRK